MDSLLADAEWRLLSQLIAYVTRGVCQRESCPISGVAGFWRSIGLRGDWVQVTNDAPYGILHSSFCDVVKRTKLFGRHRPLDVQR